MKKIINFFFIFSLLLFFNTKLYSEGDIYIKYKIQEEIVTNIDIENEARYLIALNNQLKNLSNKKIIEIATDSIIRETVKKNELKKFFVFDQKNPLLEEYIKNFYLKLKMSNKDEFERYLSNYNLSINQVKKKLEIENNWNALIFRRYKNVVSIDEDVLRKNIEKNNINQTQINYLLSEIVFEKENKIPIDEKVARIKDSINEIGFKNTANIYSISNSAKFGGDIGWVSKNELSKVFLEKIATLEIGKIVGPIKAENSFVILKLENIKEEKIKIDIKKELETMKEFEMNRQLNRYSKIYYKQIMINTNINEL